LRTLERPTNLEKIKEEVEQNVKEHLKFNEVYKNPRPNFKKVE
jgi:hypothetical protein